MCKVFLNSFVVTLIPEMDIFVIGQLLMIFKLTLDASCAMI